MNINSTFLSKIMDAYFPKLLKLRLHVQNTTIRRQTPPLPQTVTAYAVRFFYNLAARTAAYVQTDRAQRTEVSL